MGDQVSDFTTISSPNIPDILHWRLRQTKPCSRFGSDRRMMTVVFEDHVGVTHSRDMR